MGYWKLVVPEATTNLFDDPSFFLADPDTEWDISGDGAAPDWTRSTTYSFYGVSCAVADVDAGGGGTLTTIYQSITTTATSYTLHAMVRRAAGGTVSNSQCVAWFDDGAQNWDSITHVGRNWYHCVYTGTATAAANQFGVRALEDGLYVDGVQLENKAYDTTYCDGTREGCAWNGAKYTSSSTRSAYSRAGGRVQDFEDDYSFAVTDWAGWGMPPELILVDNYALAAGGQINNIKTDINTLTLTGYMNGTSLSNLHTIRQALVEELAPDKYPKDSTGWQPVRLRYTGASVHKECTAYYDSGMGGGRIVGYTETVPLRFLMADPYWYEIADRADVLDSNDAVTMHYAAGRLRSTGQWDDLGLANDPGAGGTVFAICVASDGSVYFGGSWTNWNQAGVGGDYVIRFDPTDESWNILVGASDVNAIVYDIKEGPDGTIYLCGSFTAVNGDGTADNIVAYNPTADTWSSLDDPDTTNITDMRAMAFDSSGNLYVVGNFTAVAGVANTEYIAMWDGAAWNAVGDINQGTAAVTTVSTIAINSQDLVVVGGNFDNAGGDADADHLAKWDGTSWSAVTDGSMAGVVTINSLEFAPDDILYIGGNYTDLGGNTSCDHMCAWNGNQFIPMVGSRTLTEVTDLAIAPDGRVFASFFVGGGDVTSWNGSDWEIWDFGGDVTRLIVGRQDPTVVSNYDIWVSTGNVSTEIAGITTVSNGTVMQYPVFKVSRSGGTSATLYTLINETTAKRLMFDYALLDGETLTVDMRPGKRSITSSFFGDRPDAILANSDFGSWALQPGDNDITCFVDVAGAPTVTAWLEWRAAYRGVD